MRILFIEDERRLAKIIKKGLTEEGFAVDTAYEGEEGLFLAETEAYDLIILDLMLPRVSGLTICRKLRKNGLSTPIIMLTAKSAVEDRIKGLESGADDYLGKPFSFLELRARIYALLRRCQEKTNLVLKIADLEVDPLRHSVKKGDKNIFLTPKEFAVLELLLRHKSEVITRTMIIEHVWDYNFEGMSNVVDVFISSLRRKIDDRKTKLIQTIHGVGYKIGTDDDENKS